MANAKIRQEINILDSIYTSNSTAVSNEKVQLDTAKYNGATYYWEVLAKNTNASTNRTVRLQGSLENLPTITIPNNTTSYTLFRSTSFTPANTVQNCVVQGLEASGSDCLIKSARLVIIQDAASITASETQIEIGYSVPNLTVTSAFFSSVGKYWNYNSANWDGSPTFYVEVVWKGSGTMYGKTFILQEDDGAFGSWATKVTIVNADTSSTLTRTRSASFTPTNGRNYRIVSFIANSMESYDIYSGKIIIDQTNPTKLEPQYLLLNTGDGGTGKQVYQTLWDSSEWNDGAGGLPTFKYVHDATNAADSSKLIDIDNSDADVSGATVTGANQQTSSGFTMPTTGHKIDTNVTNSTGTVAAVRITATIVLSSGPTQVSITKSLKYTIIKAASAITKSLTYRIKTVPSAITKSLKYEVVKGIAITKSVKYTTISAPSAKTKSLKYTIIKTPSAITKSLQYEIKNILSIIKTLKYTVIKAASAITKSDKYTVRYTPSAKTKGLIYSVTITPSAITKSLRYAIRDNNSITKTLVYQVAGISANDITKSLKYTIFKQISITKDLKYIIRKVISITKQLTYDIKAGISITKSLKYELKTTPAAIQKSAKYAVKTIKQITKSLNYEVRSDIIITKSLIYSIKKQSAITKSLRYDVLKSTNIIKELIYRLDYKASVVKTLLLKYNIEVYPYTSKRSPYGSKDDPYDSKNSPYASKTNPYKKL